MALPARSPAGIFISAGIVMLLAVQIPFADARPFIPEDTHRLSVPTWPIAEPGREFVRAFGPVESRRRGGVAEWSGEEVYCRATRALRFRPRLGARRLGNGADGLGVTCAFRRFLSDGGAVSRLEVGFRLRRSAFASASLDSRACLALIEACLRLPVRVPSPDGFAACELIQAGSPLGAHYLRSSTRRGDGTAPAVEPWWLSAGTPLVLIEYRLEAIRELPRFTRPVPTLGEAGVTLSLCRVERQGRRLGVWLLGHGPSADADTLRRLRIHLFRLHAERECLKRILRLIAQEHVAVPPHTPASDRLQQYLLDAGRLLMRKSRFGLPQSHLLAAAYQFDDLIAEGERGTLLAQLEGVRRSVYQKVSRYTEAADEGSGGVYVFNVDTMQIGNEIRIGRQTVTNKAINIGGNVTNSQIAVAESIVSSFNRVEGSAASDELKARLKELHDAVSALAPKLPEDQAKKVARDLDTLADEAISASPRREWYELSAKGLIEAAKTVAEMAAPVTTAVKAVLALLA